MTYKHRTENAQSHAYFLCNGMIAATFRQTHSRSLSSATSTALLMHNLKVWHRQDTETRTHSSSKRVEGWESIQFDLVLLSKRDSHRVSTVHGPRVGTERVIIG